jgi:hypothetical protein
VNGERRTQSFFSSQYFHAQWADLGDLLKMTISLRFQGTWGQESVQCQCRCWRKRYRRVSGRSLSPTLVASRRSRSSKEAMIFASKSNAAATWRTSSVLVKYLAAYSVDSFIASR